MAKKGIYKVVFVQLGEVYEIYAESIYQSDMYGFIEVEEYIFDQNSQIVLDTSEEKLKNEFPSLRIKTNLGFESANSQFKKADKSGAKIALILGKEELESKKISYKDLRTKSEQESLTFEEILKKLKNK